MTVEAIRLYERNLTWMTRIRIEKQSLLCLAIPGDASTVPVKCSCRYIPAPMSQVFLHSTLCVSFNHKYANLNWWPCRLFILPLGQVLHDLSRQFVGGEAFVAIEGMAR